MWGISLGRIGTFLLPVMGMMLAVPAHSLDNGDEFDRYWISREHVSTGLDNCRDGQCPRFSEFTTRNIDTNDADMLRRIMALLDFQSTARGLPLEHPETPQFCARQIPPTDQVIWNPEWMQMSHKLEALRGLEVLHVDVSGLSGPDGYEGDFGGNLQSVLEQKFGAAGIKIVSKEDLVLVPSQPKLSVFFSTTDPDTGCWLSVFATMTQTAVLTRNIDVKLNVGSWAFMRGYDGDNPDASEYDAIVDVFDGFVKDYTEANSPEFQPVNVSPYPLADGTAMPAPLFQVKSYADMLKDGTGSMVPEPLPVEKPNETAKVAEIDNVEGLDPSDPALGYTPAATEPQLSPKTLARQRASTTSIDGADSLAPEKLTTTGAHAE